MESPLREFGPCCLKGGVVSRVRVEALVLVVEGNGEQEPVITPGLHSFRVDMEHVCDFVESQQAGVAKTLVAAPSAWELSKSVDLQDDLFRSLSFLPGRWRQRQRQRLGRATLAEAQRRFRSAT